MERFVSEEIEPDIDTMDTGPMAVGEPAMPGAFSWRGKRHEVARVLEAWRDTGPCSHGSGERYVRKHWFRVETRHGDVMRIYFDRQPGRTGGARKRWWLYTIEDEPKQE